MTKVAIYVRVSKADEEAQDIMNQLAPLRDFARSMRYEVVAEYVDRSSGGDSNRPSFKAMLNDAAKRKFNMICVWALDRFSREGILQTLNYLKRLKMSNVSLKSMQESWLDTSDEGMGQLLLAIFSWVAEQERKRISARTKAGLRRAKNVGKRGKDKKPRKKGGYYMRHSPHLKGSW